MGSLDAINFWEEQSGTHC